MKKNMVNLKCVQEALYNRYSIMVPKENKIETS